MILRCHLTKGHMMGIAMHCITIAHMRRLQISRPQKLHHRQHAAVAVHGAGAEVGGQG